MTAPPPREDNVIDLMEALRRSLEGGSAEAKRKPAAQKTAAKTAKSTTPKTKPKPAAKPAPSPRRRAAG